MSEEELWLILYVSYGLTWSKWTKIKFFYNSLSLAIKDEFSLLADIKFSKAPSIKNINLDRETILANLSKKEVLYTSYISSDYPSVFKTLSFPPIIIFYRGNLNLCSSLGLAVIGSRLVTNYSRQVMHKTLPGILSSGVNLISGLAVGVDEIGHSYSLKFPESKTIAVLGSGVDNSTIYPSQHKQLANQICQSGGLVMSEFYCETKVLPYYFPQRNRLIVALSKVVWVVQAGIKSGTILTAKIARDTGKNLAVTPASVLEEIYSGNHKILQDGAWPLFEYQEVLSLLGVIEKKIDNSNIPLDINKIVQTYSLTNNQEIILKSITTEMNVDQLSTLTNLPPNNLVAELTTLELLSLVENIGQNNWVKTC